MFTGLPNKKAALKGYFTCGALDLTVVNENGEELDVGTDFDDVTEKAALNYYENKKSLNWQEKI